MTDKELLKLARIVSAEGVNIDTPDTPWSTTNRVLAEGYITLSAKLEERADPHRVRKLKAQLAVSLAEQYGLKHHETSQGHCTSDCYACERQGLQERIRFTSDYETLKAKLEEREAETKCEICRECGILPSKAIACYVHSRVIVAELRAQLAAVQAERDAYASKLQAILESAGPAGHIYESGVSVIATRVLEEAAGGVLEASRGEVVTPLKPIEIKVSHSVLAKIVHFLEDKHLIEPDSAPQEVVTACPQCFQRRAPLIAPENAHHCSVCGAHFAEPAYYQRVNGPHAPV